MPDMDFMDAADSGATLDPSLAALFGNPLEDTEEAPLALTAGGTVPRFDYYVGEFTEHGKGGFTEANNKPRVRLGFRITEGPSGTVNKIVFDDMYFSVNSEKYDKKTQGMVPRSSEEIAKATSEVLATLTRIANRLGLGIRTPAQPSQSALDAYAAQFTGKQCVLAVSIEKARTYKDRITGEQKTADARNRIVWRSIRAFGDEVKDAKGNTKPGVTALDEAREQIAKAEAKAGGTAATGRGASGLASQPFGA